MKAPSGASKVLDVIGSYTDAVSHSLDSGDNISVSFDNLRKHILFLFKCYWKNNSSTIILQQTNLIWMTIAHLLKYTNLNLLKYTDVVMAYIN